MAEGPEGPVEDLAFPPASQKGHWAPKQNQAWHCSVLAWVARRGPRVVNGYGTAVGTQAQAYLCDM